MNTLRAGAASVPIKLGDDCFPNAECTGIHDDVYVRVVIMESNYRWAILTADMPSMFPSDMRYCKTMLEKVAKVTPEHSWVTVNHSFSAPHTWPVGDNEQKDTMIPEVLQHDEKMIAAAECINKAYRDAYDLATELALKNMQDAVLGFGTGLCSVNINRNMETVEGWWQGVNHNAFVDRTISLIRVNDMKGNPIALLYNYSVQGSVAAGKITSEGGKLVSSDLPGAASAYVEKEYDNKCTVLFLCGATSDQVPIYKMNYFEIDKDGYLREGHTGEAGYVLLEQQGRILGQSILEVSEIIQCNKKMPELNFYHKNYICNCQKRNSDMSKLRPSLKYTFEEDGTRELSIDIITIDDIALVGLIPELDGITVAKVREESPYEKTIVCTFVNGNGKSMPKEESYSLFQYAALNSPFVAGTAEKTRDTALEMLHNIRGKYNE